MFLFSRQGETEGREEDKGAGEGKGTRKGEGRAKVSSWWYFLKLTNTSGLIINQWTGLLFACRKQKELLKALETPEEKRARRLAKIEAKKRKQKEKMGWDQEYMVSLRVAFVSSYVKSCFTISNSKDWEFCFTLGYWKSHDLEVPPPHPSPSHPPI